jgi:hypothetical protein
VHILEARAYKRIAIEYERKRVISSAKTIPFYTTNLKEKVLLYK